MKYITVPKAVRIPGVEKGDGSPVFLSFLEFHEQNVWTHPEWRSSAAKHKIFRELLLLFADLEEAEDDGAGMVLGVQDEHYEVYAPIATGRGQQLAPRIARALSPHHEAVFDAPSKDPREKTESSAETN